ncbi:indolepyruvate ferredoxin oxidoreductase family protein [Mycolicibacterium smegmatis]|uniref:indolepyruvate ferredoxin oxidoreductase family protein n=1 Tax=Mycolicibacterium smegmatis TaxID=1772 RepID=UPI001E518FBF|nr:indolepyruvate ferredoxin oxidoreductase family protein [Mycolicibacterium smegmatis]UGU28317.1 indolepyruvate ferredoxin oxidoreductase family protein [Mycolicibacterium smegmatis]ULN69319.1 indolepyruvate ferredoxin oxidoreductase family protein [Mycolicibacterium smegmatis]
MTQINDVRSAIARRDLNARYHPDSGPVVMTGLQAIVRQIVEQHERDRRAGRDVATFVSGYPGSPLAGLDQLLAGLGDLTAERAVRLVPGMNEELAATSVWGSQIQLPGGRTHDGVIGVWYGKGPGLDRACDAFRHATMYGAHPTGGMLVLVGDDPAAKSSTVPAASERSLAALSMPVFFPRNAEEIITHGLYGVALSRLSGCPSAFKIVADVADGMWSVDRDFSGLTIVEPELSWEGRPWRYRQRTMAAPTDSVYAEAELYGPRWAMVQAFNAANGVDVFEVDPADAWLGILAVGTAYDAVRQALHELGLNERELTRAGVRILRVGMPYPLDAARVRHLVRGVDTLLVVEDKVPFVESQAAQALYGAAHRPRLIGKLDHDGTPLVPADGELTADRLLTPLYRVLRPRVEVRAPRPPRLELSVLPTRRTAYFCSGCPHNRSTVIPEGSLAAGGIGCHTLVTMADREESQVTSLTQMGGEGAQWIGQAPFTDVDHIFQNLGDGTYFHSGQLAVQAAVAAGVNITYKILYNSAVAMTGAQDAQGALGVAGLGRKLVVEGAKRIIICTEDPSAYRRERLPSEVAVWHRDRLDEAQRHLRGIAGVTVLIYDQQCAADARRRRKRGLQPTRRTRVLINEAVCEGCGDCGVKSNCLSVQPVDTEFGRKTRIDQTSCNTDYTCLDGECPSFVTVELPERPVGRRGAGAEPPRAPEPDIDLPTESVYNIFLAGIGGTGIVTVNQVLAVAAQRSGLVVNGLDQTGLSQKAGPVTSHLRLGVGADESANRISGSTADCVLAFDLLTAADNKNLRVADPTRTVAIASTSRTPTGSMVRDASVAHPDDADLLARLDVSCREVVGFDALAAAQALFGNTAPSNLLLVGAAYQRGVLPIPAGAIEEAIELNGVAVQANQAAFRWGRVAVWKPEIFAAAVDGSVTPAARTVPALPAEIVIGVPAGPTRELTERRAAELVAYQDVRTAALYVGVIEQIWCAERGVGTRTEFSEAVARGLFTLMAYKDEYEVARLLTDPAFTAAVQAEFPGAGRLTYKLHPPALKALGRETKIGLGPRSHPVLRLLAKAKPLRNTVFDPFGHTRMRRAERMLADHYRAMVLDAARHLTAENYDTATALAQAADLVRGYETVKIGNIARYRARLVELGATPPDLPL